MIKHIGLTILGLALPTLAAASEPRPLDDEVLAEINYVRTHPQDYAEELRHYRDLFDGNVVHVAGDPVGEQTREGVAAVDEAIAWLDRQQPVSPLQPGAILSSAAEDLVEEQGESGATGHISANGSAGERARRHGGDIFVGETISYGYADPEAVVRQLVIDDGVPRRGHRTLLFSAGYRFAGVGCGPHPRDRYMCVIDFSGTANGGPQLPTADG